MTRIRRPLRAVRRMFLPGATSRAAATHWDRQHAVESVYWTQHPLVAQYVNVLVTGVPWLFPTQGLKAGWAYHPLERGLSIGCGSGELERDVHRQRICKRIDAFDLSRQSLRTARGLARSERMRGIRYFRGDFNDIKLRRSTYDIVFFHGSLHHVTDPDALLDEVLRALKPHGLLYVDEYVGPSRDEWTDEDMAPVVEEYERIDESLKVRPAAPPVVFEDPSEMIRSSRILPAIRERFDIMHYKPYWGNLVHPLFCCLDGARLMEKEQWPLVERLIEREKELVSSGALTDPLYAVVLARNRPR